MTTTTNTTTVGLSAEELEAAQHEGIEPISEDGLEIQQQILKLNAEMAPLLAEKKACVELLTEEMARKNARVLTYKGVPVVEKVPVTRTKTDLPGIVAKYPEVLGVYVTTETSTRFDVKKIFL